MCWKELSLYWAVAVTVVESIQHGAILRLSCEPCHLSPRGCCVAVRVAPNLALTTAFCAHSCQYIVGYEKIVPILSSHSYPQPPGSQESVALFIFKHENITNRNYVKISAVEPLSLMGRKAFVPILDRRKVYLTPTVLLSCGGPYQKLRGYYVCSSKHFGEYSLHRGKQGVPLLLNDCVLGISGSSAPDPAQDAFIALAPFLAWIEATAKALHLNFFPRTINLKDVIQPKTNILRHQKTSMVLVSSSRAPNRSASINRRTATTAAVTPDGDESTTYLFYIKPRVSHTTLHSATINKTSSVGSTKHILRMTEDVSSTNHQSTITAATNFSEHYNSSTPACKVKMKRSAPSNISTTTLQSNDFTFTNKGEASSDVPARTSSTNVMDWFRQVKATLGRQPPKILIMNTPSSIEDTTPWHSIEEIRSHDRPPTFGVKPAKSMSTPFEDLT